MTELDAFERRATAAGTALRAAFLVGPPAGATGLTATPGVVRVGAAAAPRARRALPVAAALLAACAVLVGAFVVTVQRPDPVDVLGSAGERETAVLTPPSLVGAGSLADTVVHSVERFPVPFTFRLPAVGPGLGEWWYRTGKTFDVGVEGGGGVVLLAPERTYEPGRTWQGQTRLVPAPTDAAGWAQWLESTDLVEILDREQLVIGGAPATRFTIEVAELPDAYDHCGGGRRCLAVESFDDPQVGPGQPGTGPQAGLDHTSAEVTVIELGDRAVLAVAGARAEGVDDWLPTARRLIDSLRFV